MVPRAGLEPARSCLRGILNPLCLPIPPPGQFYKIIHFFMKGNPVNWRLRPESNRRTRICSPLHDHSATQPNYLILPSSLKLFLILVALIDSVSESKDSCSILYPTPLPYVIFVMLGTN